MAKIMPNVRHCCRTYQNENEPYAHCCCASDKRLTFYNITRCYGKLVTVFPVAIAAGDLIKYQSFVYGNFVWGIHVRFNKCRYTVYYYVIGMQMQIYSLLLCHRHADADIQFIIMAMTYKCRYTVLPIMS